MTTETITVTQASERLQAIASDDAGRINMCGVYFSGKHAVATNGHMLVLRKKSPEEPSNVLIAFESKKPTTKNPVETFARLPNGEYESIDGKGKASAFTELSYPQYQQVLPNEFPDTVTVTLDAAYLLAIATALKGSKRDTTITLQFKPGSNGPMLVSANAPEVTDAVGVLMPCKTNPENSSPFAILESIR